LHKYIAESSRVCNAGLKLAIQLTQNGKKLDESNSYKLPDVVDYLSFVIKLLQHFMWYRAVAQVMPVDEIDRHHLRVRQEFQVPTLAQHRLGHKGTDPVPWKLLKAGQVDEKALYSDTHSPSRLRDGCKVWYITYTDEKNAGYLRQLPTKI